MQVSEFSLMRRKNLGNYEHIEASATIALVEGDSPDKAIDEAKRVVGAALGMKVSGEGSTSKTAQTKTSTNSKPDTNKADEKKDEKKEDTKKEEEKKSSKSSGGSKKQATKTEVLEALREYAKAKKSKEMAQAVLEDVTGADSLANVDKKDYAKLIKALKV